MMLNTFYVDDLIKRAIQERKLNIRLAWDDGFFVQADDGVYIVTDTEQSLLKAGASAIHGVLSMYDDVPGNGPQEKKDEEPYDLSSD